MSQCRALLRADGFTFRQFFVAHDRCAMKVGTDGVLLGAWAPIMQAQRILDIGTGSGLIALMLAQRSAQGVSVDAVELDEQAAAQAGENAEASPWADRIRIWQADVLTWAQCCTQRYSLIVSNPPFFAPGSACATQARSSARSTASLTHAALLCCAQTLITKTGLFCVILPVAAGDALVNLAIQQGWYLRLRTDIVDNNARDPHRVMLALSLARGEPHLDRLAIRDSAGRYSAAYYQLTRDFYLFRGWQQ